MAKPAPRSVPEGMNTVTMHLWFNGNCAEMGKVKDPFGQIQRGQQEWLTSMNC